MICNTFYTVIVVYEIIKKFKTIVLKVLKYFKRVILVYFKLANGHPIINTG